MFINSTAIPHIWQKAIRFIMLGFIIGLVFGGCSRSDSNDDESGVIILADEVIVDKSFIYSNTPERYQPSYNLRGTLAPIKQVDITSPFNGYDLDLEVQEGDWVESRQILAHLQSELNSDVALSAQYDYIDILTDEHTSLSGESVSESIEDTLEEAIPDGIELYEADDEAQTYGESDNPKGNDSNKEDSIIDSHVANSYIDDGNISDNNVDSSYATNKTVSNTTNDNKNKSSKTTSTQDNHTVKSQTANAHSSDDVKNSTGFENKVTDTLTSKKQASEIEPSRQGTVDSKTVADKKEFDTSVTPKSRQKIKTSLTFRSPMEGEVISIDNAVIKGAELASHAPFMTIADTRQLQLIGTLPLVTGSQSTESQLSVGQSVNFKVYDTHTEFTGQISHITPEPNKGYLVVRAPVIPSADNKAILEYGMQALMTIEYGQIELGVRVPREAINEANLDSLNQKYTRPVSPISGYVWVVQQDEKLAYTPIEVVRYFPESDKFLVHGINNDTLICTAKLPASSDGKRISIR